jgi:lysyl-tRNA synthetase class 2
MKKMRRNVDRLWAGTEARGRLFAEIRAYFAAHGVMEVDTPVRIPGNAPEMNIEAVRAGGGWLRTSPELHMKRLLAHGAPSIFQMGPCFRAQERGQRHREEFTLLEWYRPGGDERMVLEDLKGLLEHLARAFWGGRTEGEWQGWAISMAAADWEEIRVADAYRAAAGWDVLEEFDADRFDLDGVEKVEPWLPQGHPVALMGYPAAVAALSRRDEGDPRVARRWEAYLGGMELANAFYELTDPAEQRARFEAENAARVRMGREPYPLDEDFLRELADMPPTGGIALGLERVLMLLTGAGDIGEVAPFR